EIEKRGPNLYEHLDRLGHQLESGLMQKFGEAGVACTVQRVGSVLTPFFKDGAVEKYEDAKKCDTELFKAFFHCLLDEGVYVAPSQYEGWFLSTAHNEVDVEATVEAVGSALRNSL